MAGQCNMKPHPLSPSAREAWSSWSGSCKCTRRQHWRSRCWTACAATRTQKSREFGLW